MVKISIIIPVYNSEQYLSRLITSIQSQTFTDWETVLIDDGSTDNSPILCDSFAAKDSRFIVIHQKNSGASAARNAGLNIARGEWITFVDSDDEVFPDYLELLFLPIKTITPILIIGGMHVYRNNREAETIEFPNKDYRIKEEGKILFVTEKIHRYGFSANKLYKKSIIDEHIIRFDTNLCIAEDCMFMCQYLFYALDPCSTVCFISSCSYKYMIHPNSLSTSTNSLEKELYAYNKYKDSMERVIDIWQVKDDTEESSLFSSLPFYIDRCISAIYKEKIRSKRLLLLKSLDIRMYRYKKTKTRIDSFMKFLLIHRFFSLYDILRYRTV